MAGMSSTLEKKGENRRERCSLSFLISWNGLAGTIDKELLRSSRQRLVIVPLTGNDLRELSGTTAFSRLSSRLGKRLSSPNTRPEGDCQGVNDFFPSPMGQTVEGWCTPSFQGIEMIASS